MAYAVASCSTELRRSAASLRRNRGATRRSGTWNRAWFVYEVVRFFALIIAIGMSASGCGAIASIKGSGRQPRTEVVGIHLGGHPLQTVVGAGSVWVLICDAGCSQRTL